MGETGAIVAPAAAIDADADLAEFAGRQTTVGEILRAAARRIDRLDAEVLLADVLGMPRLAMLARRDATPARADPSLVLDVIPVKAGMTSCPFEPGAALDVTPFAALVDRRAAGEPVAYITGRREFWSLDLRVTPDVLIPRPDSETLIEAAMAHFGAGPVRAVLDLGTGSGALFLAALSHWPTATGVGVDISAAALAVAESNAGQLGLQQRARFVEGGWNAAAGSFDLILCNPPYVSIGEVLPRDVLDWEPPGALFAGVDGLDDYRQLAPVISARLAPGGVACIEIGSTQADLAGTLFLSEGLHVALRRDLAGLPRCLVVTK